MDARVPVLLDAVGEDHDLGLRRAPADLVEGLEHVGRPAAAGREEQDPAVLGASEDVLEHLRSVGGELSGIALNGAGSYRWSPTQQISLQLEGPQIDARALIPAGADLGDMLRLLTAGSGADSGPRKASRLAGADFSLRVTTGTLLTAGATYRDVALSVERSEGTLKILPGRFIIDDGENPVELRIFRTTGADRVETTIGRDGGPPYRHVQLKPLSVSGRHAKLVFENGIYTIINYSRTNPTAINGDPLPEGASRRLVDEDRIEIGEGLMVFRES